MSRFYSALKGGVVVRRGTFTDEDLLRHDFPAPEYDLRLDVQLPFPRIDPTYHDQRRIAYPPLAEFADAMYWQTQGDNSKMDAYMAAIAAVKAQFPKSN